MEPDEKEGRMRFTPPRKRYTSDVASDHTASVDWKLPNLSEPTSADSVSMQGLTPLKFGIAAKPEVGEKKKRKSHSHGHHRQYSYSKGGRKPPAYADTHKERLTRLFYTSLIILLISFLINGAFVSYGYYKLSVLGTKGDLNIDTIRIFDLDKEEGKFDFKFILPNKWYFSLFNLVIKQGAQLEVSVPGAVTRKTLKGKPLVSVRLPRMELGRGSNGIDQTMIPFKLNHEIPLKDLMDYFGPANIVSPKVVKARIEVVIQTASYWVPISFPQIIEHEFNISTSPTSVGSSAMPTIEGFEFADGNVAQQFTINVFVGYPKLFVPKYLFIELPRMQIDLVHYRKDKITRTLKIPFAEITTLAHTIRRDNSGEDGGHFPLSVSCQAHNLDSMVAMLENIRDGEWDWSLHIGATHGSLNSPSFLQRWLTTFAIDLDIAQLKKQMETVSGTPKVLKKHTAHEKPAMRIGLTAIDNSTSNPKFVNKVSIDYNYLGEMLFGLNLSLFRGALPAIKVQSVVSKGLLVDELITVCVIDLVHQVSEDKSKVEFEVRTEIANVAPFVEAGHKALKAKKLEAIADQLCEYRTFLVEVIGTSILDQLIRVFEMEFTFTNGGGLYFHRGSKRQIPLSFAADPHAPVEKPRPMKHDFRMKVTTDSDYIQSEGTIKFPRAPAFSKTFVQIYWVAMDFSLSPAEFINTQLLRFTVEKGGAQMLLSPMNPLQMLFKGSFSYVLTVTDEKKRINGVPSIIAAWRYIVESYSSMPQSSPKVIVRGQIEGKLLEFSVPLPARSYFLSDAEKQDLPMWVTDVIKTRVKIAGFHEAMLQFLLELPTFGHETSRSQGDFVTGLDMTVSLPAVHVNGCIYPKDRKQKEEIACVAQIGLHPIELTLEMIDGNFCDITTRLATENVPSALNSRHQPLLDEIESEATSRKENESLINFLPLSLKITNLRKTFEAVDAIVGGEMKAIKASVGFDDMSLNTSGKVSLLDRLFNGVGQIFPISLPLFSETPRPRTRPPISELFDDEPLSVFVDVESESRSDMKGRVIFKIPTKCAGHEPSTKKDTKNVLESLALLLAVQWGRTLVMAKFQDSWVQARVSQGQVIFRFDENRVRLDRHHEVPSTSLIVIEFAVHAATPNFSTSTLRRVINLVHSYRSGRGHQESIKHLKTMMPGSVLQVEIQTEPYSNTEDVSPDSYNWRKTAGETKPMYPRTQMSPKFRFMQELELETVLEFGRRAVQRLKLGLKGSSKSKSGTSKPAIVIRPRGDPTIDEYHFPCIIPGMCIGQRDKKLLQKGPFMIAEISIFDAVQPMIDWTSEFFGKMLDKLNFRRYPKYLAIRVRVSPINLAVAVNDIDTIKVDLDPIEIKRVARIVYPEVPTLAERGQKEETDLEQFLAKVLLPQNISWIGDILSPYSFDATMGKRVEPVPQVTVRGKKMPVHYSPLSIYFSTERLKDPSMLSTFVSMAVGEAAVSPVPSATGEGTSPPMELIRTSREQMDLCISNISIPNPISFASIVIDTPVTYRYFYKDYEFLRVYLSDFILNPGSNLLNAHVTLSRTAFGQNPNPGNFFPEFTEFLSGLSMGQELHTRAVINLGDDFQLVWDMGFPSKPPSIGVLNEDASGMDWKGHQYISWATSPNRAERLFNWGKSLVSSARQSENAKGLHKRGLSGDEEGPDSQEQEEEKNNVEDELFSCESDDSNAIEPIDPPVPSILSLDENQDEQGNQSLGIGNYMKQGLSYTKARLGMTSPADNLADKVESLEAEGDDTDDIPEINRADSVLFRDEDFEDQDALDDVDSTNVVKSSYYENADQDVKDEMVVTADSVPPAEKDRLDDAKVVKEDITLRKPFERSRHLTLEELARSLVSCRKDESPATARVKPDPPNDSTESAGKPVRPKFRRTLKLKSPNVDKHMSRDWWRRIRVVRERNLLNLPTETMAASMFHSKVLPIDTSEDDVASSISITSDKDDGGGDKGASRGVAEEAGYFEAGTSIPYRLAFRNEYNFNLMFPGMLMNMVFRDPYGYLNKEEEEAAMMGRLVVCPPSCVSKRLSERDFLDCIVSGISSTTINLPPKFVMNTQNAAQGKIILMKWNLPLMLKSQLSNDGFCVDIVPSLVSVGLSVPGRKGANMDPFLLEILMTMPAKENGSKPFSDPCRSSLACLSGPSAELFETFDPQGFRSNVHRLPSLGEVDDINRYWSHQAVPINMNLTIKFQIKMEKTGGHKSSLVQPGWALVFRKGSLPRLDKATNYGYLGIRKSFAIVCDPALSGIFVYRDGAAPPLYSKPTSFPSAITGGDWHQVSVQYRLNEKEKNERGKKTPPGEKVLVVSIWPVKNPRKKSVAVFPLDVKSIIGTSDYMHIGITNAVGRFATAEIRDFSIGAPLPDFARTRIYYLDNYSTLPGHKGRFLLGLRDSCDRVLPICPTGLQIQLRPVPSHEAKDSDANKSLFAPPTSEPVRCNIRALSSSDVYLVTYRLSLPGRYHIYVAMKRKPPRLVEPVVYRHSWHRVKNHHIYVRHVW